MERKNIAWLIANIATRTKIICATVGIIAGVMLVMFVIMTICWGSFGGGAGVDGVPHYARV